MGLLSVVGGGAVDGHADPAVERFGVVQECPRSAFVHDSAVVEDDGALGVAQRFVDLLHDDDGDSRLAAHVVEGARRFLADQRRESFQRLVEQHQLRLSNSARATESICCSPPDNCVPPLRRRSARRGKRA